MSDSNTKEYNQKCPLCETPVKVIGKTTQSYESAYDELQKECVRLRAVGEQIEGVSDILRAKNKRLMNLKEKVKLAIMCGPLNELEKRLDKVFEGEK